MKLGGNAAAAQALGIPIGVKQVSAIQKYSSPKAMEYKKQLQNLVAADIAR